MRLLAFIGVFLVFSLMGPVWLAPNLVLNIMLSLLGGLMCLIVPAFVWQIYWYFKYPPKVEFCKECGRVLPTKYED